MSRPNTIIETVKEILTKAATILSKHTGSPEINQAQAFISVAKSCLDKHLETKGDEISYDKVNWEDYEK